MSLYTPESQCQIVAKVSRWKEIEGEIVNFPGSAGHENVCAVEFGALSEDFRVAKQRIFDGFRVSDVPVPAASGSKFKTGDSKGVSGGQRSHQAVHLVGLVLFQAAQGNCQHDRHAAGDAQMHGGLAAQEVVVDLKVAAHACVDSLQGISPVKGLLPFAGIARTWTEGAHGMLSIVDLDAHDALLVTINGKLLYHL